MPPPADWTLRPGPGYDPTMQIRLHEFNHGDCPYLPDRTWVTHDFGLREMPGAAYEAMLVDGWRRSGHSFYRNHCPGCRCCTPIRVPVTGFVPSGSQRRCLRRNADVAVSVEPTGCPEDVFDLYRRYVRSRHRPDGDPEMEEYEAFLGRSPVDTRIMRYTVAGRLVGVGWVDVLANGVSSVYYAFDPEEGRRSLGTFSVMREVELAAALGVEWLYLGFYVPGSPKMRYKGNFRPCEYAVDGDWTQDHDAIPCPDSTGPPGSINRTEPDRDPR